MRKPNSNERRTAAMLRMTQSDNFGEIYDRARYGAFRKAAARELATANHYLQSLLAGTVSPRYRGEFIQAIKDCVAASRMLRSS